MKMIDIRWVKNSKTKGSSFKLVDRVPYNDYPSETATVQLTRIKEKTPDAKIHFRFPIKKGKMYVWDWKNQKAATKDVNWDFKCMVDMIFNEVESDYDYYFNFFNGKHNARINDKEIADMIAAMQVIKKDLNNLLTLNNSSK